MAKVTTALDAEIGRRLRKARLSHNLTQTGLAEQLGISFQQVQKYENGSNRVSSSRLYMIADVLDLEMVYFFEKLGSKRKPTTDPELTDQVMRVARELNTMPDGDVKQHIFALIKAYARS
jgi:transcriptional regulator with XRE-family HTH domain